MNIGDYLFPSDLAVTPTGLRRILVIGSCVAEGLLDFARRRSPEILFDYQLFNNMMELSRLSPDAASDYDFQFISLSLREIVTDVSVKMYLQGQAGALAEQAFSNLDMMLEASLKHNIDHGLLTFVANFSVPQVPVASALDRQHSEHDFTALVRRLNTRLADIASRHPNVYVADIDSIGSSLGKSSFQDDAISFYAHGAFWTPRHLEFDTTHATVASPRLQQLPPLDTLYAFRVEEYFGAVLRHLECLYRTVRQIDAVKLVIFDLDDTFWRGQIAEHYGDDAAWPQSHGWPVGIWEAVYQLRARGVLTAICSKNHEGLVRERWQRASHWVDLDDFTLHAIDFQPKAENVALLMQQASVTAKSVVFVDDNPVEREAVKAAFPAVRVIGENPYLTRRILLWSPETQVAFLSRESANRDAMVRAQQVREQERATLSREEFLQGLGCTVTVGEVRATSDAQFARSLELINKTNQFNTTGQRLSFQDAGRFFEDGGRFYVFEVVDKHTRYGLVGAVRYKLGHFVQFTMSCRVLGLEVETAAIGYIVARERAAGLKSFSAEVVDTEANMVSRDVYQKAGFLPDERGVFRLPEAGQPRLPKHLTLLPPLPEAPQAASRRWFTRG